MKVPALETINREALRRSYDIDSLAWERGVDHQKKWCPDELTHLYYCPSFDLLRDEEKLYYNQLFALGVCEQFILLEELLLVNGMERIIEKGRDKLSPELETAMWTLIEEERKHSETFRRLAHAAHPQFYANHEFLIYELRWVDRMAINLFLMNTHIFVSWVFISTLFEEKALDFYRKYALAPDAEAIDPLFKSAHRYHAMEETRHVQIDHHLVDVFWVPAPMWKKKLNDWFFHKLMTGFATPKRTLARTLDLLVQKFPRLREYEQRLLEEAMSVSKNPVWQSASYSRDSLPWTFTLFDRFPELELLPKTFPRYVPPPSRAPAPVPRRIRAPVPSGHLKLPRD